MGRGQRKEVVVDLRMRGGRILRCWLVTKEFPRHQVALFGHCGAKSSSACTERLRVRIPTAEEDRGPEKTLAINAQCKPKKK